MRVFVVVGRSSQEWKIRIERCFRKAKGGGVRYGVCWRLTFKRRGVEKDGYNEWKRCDVRTGPCGRSDKLQDIRRWALTCDVGMKVGSNETRRNACEKKSGEARQGEKASRTGSVIIVMIIVKEHHCGQFGSVQLGLVVRYALGHSRIRGLLGGHQVRSHDDDHASLPSLKSIRANEIGNGNGSVSANVVVRGMVNEVHGVDHGTLLGSW